MVSIKRLLHEHTARGDETEGQETSSTSLSGLRILQVTEITGAIPKCQSSVI